MQSQKKKRFANCKIVSSIELSINFSRLSLCKDDITNEALHFYELVDVKLPTQRSVGRNSCLVSPLSCKIIV
ncbi:Uncharacterized protein TCM_030000 [Theobroma cacao]|uniref:Uncharacterized protein n=1 Tax=Theobroma cacao TaxID=3641 RepID=A0A061GFT0_THECC|nr:Uncharacterized protein TCM_030000 [Theobroma cacao]